MGLYWVKRAGQWFYAAANVIRARGASDRLVLSGAAVTTNDDGTTPLQVGVSSSAATGITTNGVVQAGQLYLNSSAGTSGIMFAESSANFTCSGAAASALAQSGGTLSSAALYIKNNQLVVAHQCGANGQIRYLTITLDGLSCAWVQSVTAP